MEFHHVSVLLNETIDALAVKPDGIYADGTLGGGGHSFALASHLTSGHLIGFDQDENAIRASRERLACYDGRIIYVNKNFKYIKQTLSELSIDGLDGAMLDLGVSSHQLDEAGRGFSYMQDAPLDMRMDRRSQLSAYDVVNGYCEAELDRIISAYGEERWSRRIAQFIVEGRPIETTFGLVDAIKRAVPKGARQDGPHPAKRTFQAIRIEVNGELAILEQAVRDFIDVLNPGGRLAVITFHSLEDRIVKKIYAELAKGCTCPKELPICVCGKRPVGRTLTRKPILPNEQELEHNPRARSAKLRVFEKNQA